MSDEPKQPAGGDTLRIKGQSDSETAKIQREKLTLKKLDPDTAAQVAKESEKSASGDTRLSDPTRRRDTNTASLRRIRPKTSLGETNAGEEKKEDTETIHLKVIKEKKNINQLKNLLSASQTIRLRPSTGASAPASPPSNLNEPKTDIVEADEIVSEQPTPTPAGDDQKRTLKIKAPTPAEAKTESIGRAPLRVSAAPGSETQAAPGPSQLTETGELNASLQQSSKSTLKIKAPPSAGSPPPSAPSASAPDAGDNKRRSTLKIKAPTAAGSGPAAPTVKQPAAELSQRTTKQEAPKAGKTLKLKPSMKSEEASDTVESAPGAANETSAPAPQAQTMLAPRQQESQAVADEGPGMIEAVLATLTLLSGAAAAVMLFMSFNSLYS